MSNTALDVTAHPPSMPEGEVPACQKCGRQDETLRLVSYPFVISVVVITFRRAFAGMWCQTHRRQNQTLAGLISAIFGWLGFPFGLIFTPLALFQLAKGGEQPADINIQLLGALAEDKLKKGDKEGAIKCLEEALKFREDQEIQGRLRQLRSLLGAREESIGCLPLGTRLLGGIFTSLLIGVAVGVLDYISGWVQFLMFGTGETSIYLIVLSFAPLLVAIFVAGMGLAAVIEATLLRIQVRSPLPAFSFAVMAGLICMYGIFEGNIIVDNAYALFNNQFGSLGEIIVVGILTLFAGGFFWMAVLLENLGASPFYLIVLVLGFGFFILLGLWKARVTLIWQERIRATYPGQ